MSEKQSVDFFFNPLKSKLLIALITCQVLFVLLFQRIFGKVFFLAPDERGYLQVAKDVYSTDYDYVQWGWPWRSPVWFLQLIYSPFKFMLEVGIPDLIAFRFNAILYSSLSIYLMLAILYVHYPPTELLRRHKFSLLTIFLPTYFLWSTLGLRESFLYFSFSLIGSGITLLTNARWRLGFLLMSTGCIFLAYTKDYMYLIFVVSLLFLILLRSLRRQISFKPTSLYLIALIIPILLTPSITLSLHGQVKQIVFGDEVPRANLAGNSTGGEIGAWGTERGLVENCENNSSIEFILKLVKPSEKISGDESCNVPGIDTNPSGDSSDSSKSDGTESPSLLSGNEIGWETSRAAKLSLEPAHLSDPGKLFIQFVKIVTLPLPLFDNGSSTLNIVAWESPIWLTLILLVYLSIILSLVSRRKISDLNLWSSTFIFGILLSSALTEINVGTMVRHRSLVLILCLFVILTMDRSIYTKSNFLRLFTNVERKGK
jgi:hypothetical protein